MKFDIGKHPDRAGVWCVFGWGDRDGDERIISTHSTRDGAVVSCRQLRMAEDERCLTCGGVGCINTDDCDDCGGTGRTPENVETPRLVVHMPRQHGRSAVARVAATYERPENVEEPT